MMRFSDFIIDLGRTVAFHPGLKKITGSTTATLLLCQFLYWRGKKGDNWIYKTADEIEEETGLTYNEQKTARDKLVELNILVEERKRLDHTSRYKIDINVFNNLCEETFGVKSKLVSEIEDISVEVDANPETHEETPEEYFTRQTQERQAKTPPPVRNIPGKKGDIVDGVLAANQSSGMKKVDAMIQIKLKIQQKLHVLPNNKKWDDFIEFVYNRETKDKEDFDTFAKWAIKEGFNAIYWTPEKMASMWPQAFIKEQIQQEEIDDFTPPVPKKKVDEYMEMPTSFIKRLNTD